MTLAIKIQFNPKQRAYYSIDPYTKERTRIELWDVLKLFSI